MFYLQKINSAIFYFSKMDISKNMNHKPMAMQNNIRFGCKFQITF